MRYMGGKTQVAKYIVESILSDTVTRHRWWEPFVGGANVMERAAPHFHASVGTDVHDDLILMWQHVVAGGVLPEMISEDDYRRLKNERPSWLRGVAGFGASFGGKWFGGYGRERVDRKHPNGHVYPGVRDVLIRQGAVFAENGVRFLRGSYADFTPPPGTVVYCDPPYASTTGYSSTGALNYQHFYATTQRWARTCDVYVSEYAIPNDVPARVIWEREKRVSLKAGDNATVATERLFRILPG